MARLKDGTRIFGALNVNTAIVLTDAQINVAPTLAASFGQANLAYATANGAQTWSVAAFSQANLAYAKANTANITADSSFGTVNLAYAKANTANITADSSFGAVNVAYATVNLAFARANTANITADASFGAVNLAFARANTANITADASFGKVNLAYAQANTANVKGDFAFSQANLAYAKANTAYIITAGKTAVTTLTLSGTAQSLASTLAGQTLATNQVYRIRAYGTLAAISSGNIRQVQFIPYWGASALTSLTSGAVLVNSAQTTNWQVEFLLTASSATAIWTTGQLVNKFASANALDINIVTPASTATLTSASTLDLRAISSGVATADVLNIHSVTIERMV